MDEIKAFDDHETWLDRQHALLAELDAMGPQADPAGPRKLGALPLWKDGNRLDGEAQRILDAGAALFGNIWQGLKAALRALFTSRAGHALGVAFLLWCLFAAGAVLYDLTEWLL